MTSSPILRFGRLTETVENIKQCLRAHGYCVLTQCPFLDHAKLLGGTSSLFDAFHESPAVFEQIDSGYFRVYLPTGWEHLSDHVADEKAVIDVFPKSSYTYDHYSHTPLLKRSASTSERAAIDMSQVNRCLDFLKQTLTALDPEYQRFVNETRANWLVRLLNYPPVNNCNDVRLDEHVDDDLLVMVVASHFHGLQFVGPKNKWLDFPNIENSALLFCGGCLELLTNGAYKAVRHRVRGGTGYAGRRYAVNINLGADMSDPAVGAYYASVLQSKYLVRPPP